MSSSDYINARDVFGSSLKKSYSTVDDIIIALNQPTSSEYEWAAADELMYLTALDVWESPQIQATYNSQLSKYAEYLEKCEGVMLIPFPDAVNVSAFSISPLKAFLSEPLPMKNIPKAKFILTIPLSTRFHSQPFPLVDKQHST